MILCGICLIDVKTPYILALNVVCYLSLFTLRIITPHESCITYEMPILRL